MEQTILACDVCGKPAATTVTIKADGKSLQKDLCADHVSELVNGARPARPGRRRSVGPKPTRRRAATGAKSGKSRRSAARAKSTRTRRPRRGAGTTAATEETAESRAE
jgi:hypothetical protein